MAKRETYLWRIAATGACFALFGLGGLALGLVVFPILLLVVRDEDRRRRHTRALVHRAFRLFVRIMSGVGGISYEIHGQERLGRSGQLIIANHPSLIDVVLIIGTTPASCVVKQALFSNPFTRRVVSAAGYISNNPTDLMIIRAGSALRDGDCLVMFPEGTRTRPGKPLQFHRGAASVAVQAAGVLTPVYITCEPVLLPKYAPWYRAPPRKPHFVIRVGQDIDLEGYRGIAPPKASRALNDWLLAHYTAVLSQHDGYNEDAPEQGFFPRMRESQTDN
jgi:1-acyl-sn-glycerol-3-phosphate acyltransferase